MSGVFNRGYLLLWPRTWRRRPEPRARLPIQPPETTWPAHLQPGTKFGRDQRQVGVRFPQPSPDFALRDRGVRHTLFVHRLPGPNYPADGIRTVHLHLARTRKARMKRAILVALLATFAMATHGSTSGDLESSAVVDGTIVLSTEGTVQSAEVKDEAKYGKPIADMVRKAALQWLFYPVRREGKPVP